MFQASGGLVNIALDAEAGELRVKYWSTSKVTLG